MDTIWDQRRAAAAKIGCLYEHQNGHAAAGRRHRIYRVDGSLSEAGKTFKQAMESAVEALYAGDAPPVPLAELLVD
jgi:hypothetical protein